ncbi:hypothetical protein HaLaN_24783 [Haematococcus lacustris]|uniref:Uncharacterized protein n=1 Tax=Haematococcus lacustris TaxID=44745 RepID=A0A699ZUP1_HAELA|nr:hypothetical protein HaLaN_24783 [Haematococcus lacustris]
MGSCGLGAGCPLGLHLPPCQTRPHPLHHLTHALTHALLARALPPIVSPHDPIVSPHEGAGTNRAESHKLANI